MTEKEMMRLAIDTTKTGIQAGQTPFGAVIVRDGHVVATAHNTVWRDRDPTAHAEVNAIRMAGQTLHSIDFSGCTMYTTCEPCPMCLTAIHWAKIERVVYGATIADAAEAGFSELKVDAEKLAAMGGSPLKVEQGPLREECRDLFRLWKQTRKSGSY